MPNRVKWICFCVVAHIKYPVIICHFDVHDLFPITKEATSLEVQCFKFILSYQLLKRSQKYYSSGIPEQEVIYMWYSPSIPKLCRRETHVLLTECGSKQYLMCWYYCQYHHFMATKHNLTEALQQHCFWLF